MGCWGKHPWQEISLGEVLAGIAKWRIPTALVFSRALSDVQPHRIRGRSIDVLPQDQGRDCRCSQPRLCLTLVFPFSLRLGGREQHISFLGRACEATNYCVQLGKFSLWPCPLLPLCPRHLAFVHARRNLDLDILPPPSLPLHLSLSLCVCEPFAETIPLCYRRRRLPASPSRLSTAPTCTTLTPRPRDTSLYRATVRCIGQYHQRPASGMSSWN